MPDSLVSIIQGLVQAAREKYGVNPAIFLTIYLACVPLFYYSLFHTLRALRRHLGKEVMLWSAIFLCSTVAPFVYVLLFGRNLPWWAYTVIAILIGQGVLALVMKLRRNATASEQMGGP
jgi:DMSO/TMAO reductase YedYZ heme-binding membrane subunit